MTISPESRSWRTSVYEFALQVLLPHSVLEQDGWEMVETYDAIDRERQSATLRLLFLLRSLVRLPKVAWEDHRDERRWQRELEQQLLRNRPPRTYSASSSHAFSRAQAQQKPNNKPKERPMTRILQDFNFALRTLRRAPGYSIGAILLLALGVGAVTTIFTLFDNILLRPLPYPNAERLVVIDEGSHTGPFWRELQDIDAVETWAAARDNTANLTGNGDPLVLRVSQVSEDFFNMFGARATEGRLLAPDDFETADRVVLSYGAWQSVFGEDPSIVGQSIQLNGETLQVVGVVQRSFSPPEALSRDLIDVWRPINWNAEEYQSPNFYVLGVAALLKPGLSVEEFQSRVQAKVVALDESLEGNPFRDREGNLWEAPVVELQEITVRGVRTGLGLLLGAVGLLLLIACSNVAHLSVARGLARVEEMSLRRALGAKTSTLLGQLFIESLVIAILGGLLGIASAMVAVKVYLAALPEALPRDSDLALDFRIVAFAALISSLTALVFGLLPALQTVGRTGSTFSNRSNSPERSSAILRNTLVIAEVALSLMLLVGAGVLIRSFAAVTQQDTGFVADNVWRIPLSPPDLDDPAPYIREMESIRQALQTVPGVESATYGLTLPFSFVGGSRCCWGTRVTRPEDTLPEGSEKELSMSIHPVSQDYFSTLGIPLSLGSMWNETDATAATVPVILPQATASELFGSPESAIRQRLMVRNMEAEVVAIAGDVPHYGLDQTARPSLYLPIEKLAFGIDLADFAVKTGGPPPINFIGSLKEAIWSVAPALPVPDVAPIQQRIRASTAERRFDSILFASFGAIALLLAASGLYGTLAYSVSRRRKEMGIRIALGAAKGRVEALILRSGVTVALLGAMLGLIGAWATAKFLESRIWGVEARDTTSLVVATALLLAVATLACWLPARRAAKTDPVEALRAE